MTPIRTYDADHLENSCKRGSALRCRGPVDQEAAAGIPLWARAMAFTSLWPEPWGISGIDAQIFGVPLAAFALGAPLDWPMATLIPAGNVASMAEWLHTRPETNSARDPAVVSQAMSRHWDFVASRAETLLETFIRHGNWQTESTADSNPVHESLVYARGGC